MCKHRSVVICLVLLALANGASANEFTGAVDNRFCEAGTGIRRVYRDRVKM
jgi:hypothetical protein